MIKLNWSELVQIRHFKVFNLLHALITIWLILHSLDFCFVLFYAHWMQHRTKQLANIHHCSQENQKRECERIYCQPFPTPKTNKKKIGDLFLMARWTIFIHKSQFYLASFSVLTKEMMRRQYKLSCAIILFIDYKYVFHWFIFWHLS